MFALFSLLGLLGVPSFSQGGALLRQSTAPIMVVFPHEGDVVGPASSQFILGSVFDPKGTLEINGSSVPIYKTGAFLAWLPVQSETDVFHCVLKSGGVSFSYDRRVRVLPWPPPLPKSPISIDPASIDPNSNEELRPGDWLTVRFKGSPGGKAWFRWTRHSSWWGRSWIKMREQDPHLGIYEGLYQVSVKDQMKPAPIELYLSGLKRKTKARVSFNSGPPPVALIGGSDPVLIKAEPRIGEMFPVFPGTRVLTGERLGGWTRLNFSGGQSGWVQTRDLNFLPADSSPPDSETGIVIVKSEKKDAVVRLALSERTPFEMIESSNLSRLTVLIYNAHLHTNWIVYQDDSFVRQVRIRQKERGLVELRVDLKRGLRLWGSHASFDGNALTIELRRPPTIAANALKGRVIFLDPGHMPSAPGAIGGLGTKEMDVNLAIAHAVEGLLKKEGATAVLSHADNAQEVPLAARPLLAWEAHADVFVSIHNNNIASGENPFKSQHGYSIFYYEPQSLRLARAVHREYKKFVPLPDEGMRYGNYLVLRMTEMPAILTESAYLSYPDQEADLLNPHFQLQIAHAIVAGLRSFFESWRPQRKPAVVKKLLKVALKPAAKRPQRLSRRRSRKKHGR